jgi:hypothetical protein
VRWPPACEDVSLKGAWRHDELIGGKPPVIATLTLTNRATVISRRALLYGVTYFRDQSDVQHLMHRNRRIPPAAKQWAFHRTD